MWQQALYFFYQRSNLSGAFLGAQNTIIPSIEQHSCAAHINLNCLLTIDSLVWKHCFDPCLNLVTPYEGIVRQAHLILFSYFNSKTPTQQLQYSWLDSMFYWKKDWCTLDLKVKSYEEKEYVLSIATRPFVNLPELVLCFKYLCSMSIWFCALRFWFGRYKGILR